eukprot:TRINITY_DN32590_c0_g1_i1.p1 TRINITY_DN32590_c0_g1~~TRINITY_DN32590_c0_g1_i1.p1  ORF type:complete len:197 (+),score=46.88 TRINITY_DN32590_c0_g1_i1:120-710(+)
MMASPVKKKAAAAAVKDGKDAGALLDEKLKKAALRIQSLERELVNQMEQTARANAARNELRTVIENTRYDLERRQEDHFDIASEMTRQYLTMQSSLLKSINELENRNAELCDQLDASKAANEELRKEFNRNISAKDATILTQQRKMDQMALDFNEILKETIDKMSERIEEHATKNLKQPPLPPHISEQLAEFNIRL